MDSKTTPSQEPDSLSPNADRGSRPEAQSEASEPSARGKPKSRRRVVMIAEPEDDERHDSGSHLASEVSSVGRTPRFKGPVEKGTHTVDSTDGVKLCVKTWPSSDIEADPAAASKKLLVVLVHQYSVMGGCQDLVVGLARHLNTLKFSCVTFDQRGVGQSTGSKSITGIPEVNDVISVCLWAAEKYGRRLLLVGSSAGAPISGSALDAVDEIDGYVAIGYVFGFWASILFGSHFDKVLSSPKPRLFIMGTKDQFTTPKQLSDKLSKVKGVANVHLIEGYGHFEIESPQFDEPLAELISKFAQSVQDGF